MITTIVAGKWALELGFRQTRQLLWMIASAAVPPFALITLHL